MKFSEIFQKVLGRELNKIFQNQKILSRIDAARRELSIYGVLGKIDPTYERKNDEKGRKRKKKEEK